jgi:chorismate mutase
MNDKRLYGLRGAVFCRDEASDIERRVAELYDALIPGNRLTDDDIVSLTFSVTADIRALNPAAALRKSGRGANLALFAVAEASSVDAPSGVIRALIHCYAPIGAAPRHAYLNGAQSLRPDRLQEGGA